MNFRFIRQRWEWIDRLSAWQAALICAVVCWFITSFFYSPPFWLPLLGGGETPSRIDDFARLCGNPLARDLNEPILAYRITTPLLAWLLGLRGTSGVILQYAAIVLTLALVFVAMMRRSDRTIAFWTVLGVAVSFTIIWTNDFPGFPDSVTHLAVAVLLLSRNPVLTAGMTVAGTMNDERFVLAVPFVLCWHGNRESVATLIRTSWKQAAGFIAGLVVVFFLRRALTEGWIGAGIELPEVYKGIAATTSSPLAQGPHGGWPAFWINVVMAYRGLWLILIWAALRNLNGLARLVPAGCLLLVIVASGTVADVSRSIGFAFPAFLLAVLDLSGEKTERRSLLPWLVVACLLTPCFHAQSSAGSVDIQVQYPLPVALLRAWGWDVLSILK